MAENIENRKCFKCGRSSVDPKLKLFRFPKPGIRNLVRCELWAKYCLPDCKSNSRELQQKLYNEHKMLCNRHFKRTSFSDYPVSNRKLHRFAVPDAETQSGVVDDSPRVALLDMTNPAYQTATMQCRAGSSHSAYSVLSEKVTLKL